MSRVSVFSEGVQGGDRYHLDAIGLVSGVRYSTSAKGDLAASWQMQLDPKTDHTALKPGRGIRLPFGANKGWAGTLGNPRRGDVWEFNAQGSAWLANNRIAVGASGGGSGSNGLDLDDVVDAAITRGLPWTRPSSLPALTDGSQQDGTSRLSDALDTVCDAKGKLWNVSRDGEITAATRPTSATYLLLANDTAGGRTVLGFVTDVWVTYWDQSTWMVKTILRESVSKPFGVFEDVLDITDLGPITQTQAEGHGDNWLAKRAPRLRFTQAFTVTYGQLLTIGGTAVDLATVQAAGSAVRVLLTDPDSAAGELALGSVVVPVGETDYDVDADVLTVTPLDTTPTGLAAVFS